MGFQLGVLMHTFWVAAGVGLDQRQLLLRLLQNHVEKRMVMDLLRDMF